MNSSISHPETVLITGASSGIGYELAKIFALKGCRLVLVAKNDESLHAVATEICRTYGVFVKAIPKDLSLVGSTDEITDELRWESCHVDILVNNAGFGTYGPFPSIDADRAMALMQVNMIALTHLTQLLLREMLSRRRGRILNVASTAAFQPGPMMAVYYASKAYVLSFSEALANELRGSGIKVSALCPGPTQTEFQRRAGIKATKLFDWLTMDAQKVAEIAYRSMMKNKTVIIPGFTNNLLAFAVRFLPRIW